MTFCILEWAVLQDTMNTTANSARVTADIIEMEEETTEIVLNRQINETQDERSIYTAASQATHATLLFIVDELAKAQERDSEKVLASYYQLRTMFLNKELNVRLKDGRIKNDPRNPQSGNHARHIGAWYDRSIDPNM